MTDAECRSEMRELVRRSEAWKRNGEGPLHRKVPTPYQKAVIRRIMDLFDWDEGDPILEREEWEKTCPPCDVREG